MKINRFKAKLIPLWHYFRSRDLAFWSVVSTLLLVFITFFLAVATKQMADVMSKDYMMRTMPVFRMTTPQVSTNETEAMLNFTVANVSAGMGKGTIHHVFIQDKKGNIVPVENVIVGKDDWAKKLNEIPIDYVSGTQEIIKLTWPRQSVSPQAIEAVVIALEFHTLFDDQPHFQIEGYLYEFDHNNFDPMTKDRLAHILDLIESKVNKPFRRD